MTQPAVLPAITEDTIALGFSMASDPLTGSFLRTLAASKPQARFLEIGTGTGLSTAWILDGMDRQSTLLTVDSDSAVTTIAHKHLGDDPRLTIQTMDGRQFLQQQRTSFDFIFADSWPGKFDHLEVSLNLLNVGGIYIIDDLLPQPNWPQGHDDKVTTLLETLRHLDNFSMTEMDWSTGLALLVKLA